MSNELIVEFDTGKGGLRGVKDNVDLILILEAGEIRFENINESKPWAKNSTNTVVLPLNSKIKKEDILGIKLQCTDKRGYLCDIWNLNGLCATLRTDNEENTLMYEIGSPLYRFRRGMLEKFLNIESKYPNAKNEYVNELTIEIDTGNFSLRGDEENVNLILILEKGNRFEFYRELRFENINASEEWYNKSTNTITIPIESKIKTSHIFGFQLEYTGDDITWINRNAFKPGRVANWITIGGWDLNRLRIQGKMDNSDPDVLFNASGNSLFNFTSNNRIFKCTATVPSAPQFHSMIRAPNHKIESIQWKKPDFDGYSDILQYEVWDEDEGEWKDAGLKKNSDDIFSYEFNNYISGTYHMFKIRAFNICGYGEEYSEFRQIGPT